MRAGLTASGEARLPFDGCSDNGAALMQSLATDRRLGGAAPPHPCSQCGDMLGDIRACLLACLLTCLLACRSQSVSASEGPCRRTVSMPTSSPTFCVKRSVGDVIQLAWDCKGADVIFVKRGVHDVIQLVIDCQDADVIVELGLAFVMLVSGVVCWQASPSGRCVVVVVVVWRWGKKIKSYRCYLSWSP